MFLIINIFYTIYIIEWIKEKWLNILKELIKEIFNFYSKYQN